MVAAADPAPPSKEDDYYVWETNPEKQTPPEVLQLWTEVGAGIDKSQTGMFGYIYIYICFLLSGRICGSFSLVISLYSKKYTVVWKAAVESLDHGLHYLSICPAARAFCERYAGAVVGILSEQAPSKIGPHERSCVQDSLAVGCRLVAADLNIQLQQRRRTEGGHEVVSECRLLDTILVHVFSKRKAFYKGTASKVNHHQNAWQSPSNHSPQGFPEVRLRNIETFRSCKGFFLLHSYLLARIPVSAAGNPTAFPTLETLHHIITALHDTLPPSSSSRASSNVSDPAHQQKEEDAIAITRALMQYFQQLSDDALKKTPTELLSITLKSLQKMMDRLTTTRRAATMDYYSFWRSFILTLISSPSLPLKLAGWEQVNEMIKACADHRPPPRQYLVRDAGVPFCNGTYDFCGPVLPDGYTPFGADVSYVHVIPNDVPDVGGRKLTLFRCTMRSQQKWWFLSEADEEQPGTDRDIDYYQHKSSHETAAPPADGWIPSRTAGRAPPPRLQPRGVLVPPGQERATLEHQLATWAIENAIVEQVLGDTTIHREVVARSTALIQFLAAMCARDEEYGLQASHLLFAWKTCTRKADAAVSLQVYQLLVSILPACPSHISIPLLRAIQTSLHLQENVPEVAEFCSALAAADMTKSAAWTDEVREEVLNLLWAVLTHPVAGKSDTAAWQQYVTRELKVEPHGAALRERFLRSCITVLTENAAANASSSTAAVEEIPALRMVKLTWFILEACPRTQAHAFVYANQGALPQLLFTELVAYLQRRRREKTILRPKGVSRKPSLQIGTTGSFTTSSASGGEVAQQQMNPLEDRLRILRHVYGLSDPTLADHPSMTAEMLHTLWDLCLDTPTERESIMTFIASASHPGKVTAAYGHWNSPSTVGPPAPSAEPLLSAAFSEAVCQSVFADLFCSPNFDYETLGLDGYRSFQCLLPRSEERAAALDAMWRICLSAGNDAVASQAMQDLLQVYVSALQVARRNPGTVTTEVDENFGVRMYQCLERVKADLEARAPSGIRSIERCMRILNAAIGRVESEGLTTTPTLARLSALMATSSNFTLDAALKCLPHGMRAQSCCRRIGVMARRPQNQNAGNYDTPSAAVSSRNQPNVKFSLDVHPLETLATVKRKVALHCQCSISAVKPIQITGRSRGLAMDPAHLSLTVVPEDTVMDELGVVQGCEMVFVLAERNLPNNIGVPPVTTHRSSFSNDLSTVFFSHDSKFADQLFSMVLSILEILPWNDPEEMLVSDTNRSSSADIHKLVWDLLLAMPTNERVASNVRSIVNRKSDPPESSANSSMIVDGMNEPWSQLLDVHSFDRSVYVLKTIDAFLQPSPEALSIIPTEKRIPLEKNLLDDAHAFRNAFIDADGFGAVVTFFSTSGKASEVKTRQGNAAALRILKSCLFGNVSESQEMSDASSSLPDIAGLQLLRSLSDTRGLLKSLTTMVVEDPGISSSTILDVSRFLRLLFQSPSAAEGFVELSDAKTFLGILLMWDENPISGRISSSVSAALQVRRGVHDLILQTPALAENALPWLVHAIESVDVESESTSEYFAVLEKLVSDSHAVSRTGAKTDAELRNLSIIVCKKLASCPRPGSEIDLNDVSTGVLSGCLKLLRALVEFGNVNVLKRGVSILLSDLGTERWSEFGKVTGNGVLSLISTPLGSRVSSDDVLLVDLMGAIFDGFLSPGGSSSVAICCDKDSRARGFEVVGAAARKCDGPDGYLALARRIGGLISSAAPKLRHRWGQFGSTNEHHARNRVSKYAGLRNQGCTCYMNSVLQQLFMMPELRRILCEAPLPAKLRSVGSKVAAKGADLVGKKISLQWDAGVSFDAFVESYDESTDMHTIRYCPIEIAVAATGRQQLYPGELARLPPVLPDEFVLSEGRPGKETGVFDIIPDPSEMDVFEARQNNSTEESTFDENEDEAKSRHLLEEVQRTFIHLEEGSRGQCFDPRALVEACSFLKLEFDVWQQNDASEFATKLLDRLEISLKKWAPSTFHHMDHTFGVKQTKQKTCKKCGLKTNREEKLLTIDCQIRGKSDIQEALSAMTEVEIMEGSNQVYCDRCNENTDTILKSAISTFPNMLILSLKRFDLDYNTFETVKLNSRCAFGQTLNMKKYSLDALEALERAEDEIAHDSEKDPSTMETEESLQYADGEDPLSGLPHEKYEYRLAGVLVHAGVAQGGHYYSFIKDRITGSDEKWYRFDDDDVTPFDPSLIETECFGGKVKKETKWPNGQIHIAEQEQFANALMVFYEKVVPNDIPPIEVDSKLKSEEDNAMTLSRETTLTGYDVFEPDVSRSNEIHRWQSFLFDVEFRNFLKGMLRFSNSGDHTEDAQDTWRSAVVRMLLSFVFDVLMYSSDYASLNDWSRILEEILLDQTEIATSFVHDLARRATIVSGNWLRTYIMDCPDHSLRAASLRMFTSAIASCSKSVNETKALTNWIRGWREQLGELRNSAGDTQAVVPCQLQGKFRSLEDSASFGAGASCLGVIISFTCTMLEMVPRSWRFSPELCIFVRCLASMSYDTGDSLMRRALIDAQVPARIIVLVARDRSTSSLKSAFPGTSVSADVAATQMRPESNPNAHMMHMSGNSGLGTSDVNSPRGPNHSDYVVLLEALSCLAGIQGMLHSPLVIRETDDVVRGRQWYSLTDDAVKALSTIFHEACAPNAPGMGQREIELYLQRCGVDTGGVSTQKIVDMLSKYPTTNGTDKERATYLSLDGFIAYYRDCVQSNDVRLRLDLHTFGFRPNLSRRSRESRYFRIGERESQCLPTQSVALDIGEMFKDKQVQLGLFNEYGLMNTPALYSIAHEVSGPLMEYLVAAVCYRKNADSLIDRTLVSIYLSSNDWEGNKTVSGATAMLEVIAAMPGDDQPARINRIMMSNMKAQRSIEFGSGILVVLRALYHMRQSQHYSNEAHWTFNRYIHLLKNLYNLYPIFKWMGDNHGHWSFIERELESTRSNVGGSLASQHNIIRSEFIPREPEAVSALEHNTNSDSEMGGMQDSEEDDEDSNFDHIDMGVSTGDGPSHITVEGAGSSVVNGLYVQDGFFESALRYVRYVHDESAVGNSQRFFIVLCSVLNYTRYWYISIVPAGASPGTSSDIDFYTAPVTESSLLVPPKKGWTATSKGLDPPPRLVYGNPANSNADDAERIRNGNIVEDDVDDDPQDEGQDHAYL
jgi:ubiquitin carboxyl-terminal hydrolase 9/24